MYNKYLWKFIFLVLIIFIFISLNFHLYRNFRWTPQGTQYFGATGYFFDYYQYLSFIKDGERGRILLSSHYIPELKPPVLLHTFFSLSGWILSPLRLTPFIVYYILNNIFLLTWIVSLFLLVKVVVKGELKRRFTYLLILTASAFPVIKILNSKLYLDAMIPFAQNTYFLQKFSYSPHHLFANTLLILLIIIILNNLKRPKIVIRHYLPVIFISFLIMIANPTTMTYFLLVMGVLSIPSIIRRKEEDNKFLIMSVLILLTSIPLILYYNNVFQTGDPWKYYYYGEKVGRFDVSFYRYLGSLGVLFFTSLLSFLYYKKFRFSEWLFAVWEILPIIIFPFAGRQIPYSMGRLFTLNLFIPSSFLTAFFLSSLARSHLARLKLIIIFITITTVIGVYFSITKYYNRPFDNYYNVFIPDNLFAAISYINKNSRSRTTILAGENISNLIPVLTDNQVVLGRLDAYQNYYLVKDQVDDIYLRRIQNREISNRLRAWNVQYIIFGLDHVSYNEFIKKSEIPDIKKVFSSGNIVLAEVL